MDIDSLSVELTKELALPPLEKALPPKLRYRFYKWLKDFRGKQPRTPKPAMVQQAVQKAVEHMAGIKELKKNEIMASFYDNGHLRMDFGGEVDKKVKDAALRWAKRRGLRASEASLDKSDGANSYIVFSNGNASPRGVPAKFVKYST